MSMDTIRPVLASSEPYIPQPSPPSAAMQHLTWPSLVSFIHWKRAEELRIGVKLVSGLSHTLAHAYALRTRTILYLCEHRNSKGIAAKKSMSCSSFLRAKINETGEVSAWYDNRHSHETVGRLGKEGEKDTFTIPSPVSTSVPVIEDDAHAWDIAYEQYSHDIIESIANLDLKKEKAVDPLPGRDIPQHNWGLYSSAHCDIDALFSSFCTESFSDSGVIFSDIPSISVSDFDFDPMFPSLDDATGDDGYLLENAQPRSLGDHNVEYRSVEQTTVYDNLAYGAWKERLEKQPSAPCTPLATQANDPQLHADTQTSSANVDYGTWISPARWATSGGEAIRTADDNNNPWRSAQPGLGGWSEEQYYYGWDEAPWEKAASAEVLSEKCENGWGAGYTSRDTSMYEGEGVEPDADVDDVGFGSYFAFDNASKEYSPEADPYPNSGALEVLPV